MSAFLATSSPGGPVKDAFKLGVPVESTGAMSALGEMRASSARGRYPSTFPAGPPREAIIAEKLLPAALAMLSESFHALHWCSFAA